MTPIDHASPAIGVSPRMRARVVAALTSRAKGWQLLEYVELFRIDHLAVEQPFGMRSLGHGFVKRETSDGNQRDVVLQGLQTSTRWRKRLVTAR